MSLPKYFFEIFPSGFYHTSNYRGDGYEIVIEEHLRMLDGQRKLPNRYPDFSVDKNKEPVDWWTSKDEYKEGASLLRVSSVLNNSS